MGDAVVVAVEHPVVMNRGHGLIFHPAPLERVGLDHAVLLERVSPHFGASLEKKSIMSTLWANAATASSESSGQTKFQI